MGDGVLHIMSHHHGGKSVLCNDLVRDLQHLCGGLRVQRRRMLVQQKEFWLSRRCHEKRDRLPLPSGEKSHLGGKSVLQAKIQLFELALVIFPLLLRDSPAKTSAGSAPGGDRHIFLNGHGGRRPGHRVLEHTAQIRRPFMLREPRDVCPVHYDLSRIHVPGSCYGVQRG